nr:hypothetical transcript [Hymenolepis microstoma]
MEGHICSLQDMCISNILNNFQSVVAEIPEPNGEVNSERTTYKNEITTTIYDGKIATLLKCLYKSAHFRNSRHHSPFKKLFSARINAARFNF